MHQLCVAELLRQVIDEQVATLGTGDGASYIPRVIRFLNGFSFLGRFPHAIQRPFVIVIDGVAIANQVIYIFIYFVFDFRKRIFFEDEDGASDFQLFL